MKSQNPKQPSPKCKNIDGYDHAALCQQRFLAFVSGDVKGIQCNKAGIGVDCPTQCWIRVKIMSSTNNHRGSTHMKSNTSNSCAPTGRFVLCPLPFRKDPCLRTIQG